MGASQRISGRIECKPSITMREPSTSRLHPSGCTTSSPTSRACRTLSPEIVRSEWLDGASSATPGAQFKSTNKVSGRPAWNNKPVITVTDPGREIAWTRTELFAGTVEWRYRFEPEGSGTRVTESYQDHHAQTRVRTVVALELLVYTPDEWAALTTTRPFVREETLVKSRVTYDRSGAAVA